MDVRLDRKLFDEVYCFKYLGSQVAADGGCEMEVVCRMNEGFKSRGVLKIC